MNHIAFSLFLFTLGSLAAKIPADVDKSERPGRNPESLEKRSSDLSNAFQESITRRTSGKHNSGLYFFTSEIYKAIAPKLKKADPLCWQVISLVSFAAAIRVVTHRFATPPA